MGRQVDYAKIAREMGGAARTPAPSVVDYAALAREVNGDPLPSVAPVAPPRGWLSPSTPADFLNNPAVYAARGVGNAIKKIPGAIYSTVTDPVGTVGGVFEAQGRVGQGAADAYQRGDYLTAARKGVNYLLPVVGPMMDAKSDRVAAGANVVEEMAELGTDVAMMLAPLGPKGAKVRPPRLAGPANAVEAAAVQFARDRGVPLDLGTATGRQLIKNTQKRVGNTMAGEAPALKMQESQATNLARVGQELADQAGPAATNPVAAGEAVRAALKKQIEDLHVTASGAYDVLRQTEQALANGLPTNPKILATMQASQRTPLGVDLTAAVKQLQPLYQQLKRESELGIPMQGAKGRTLAALDGLMNAPNVAPLSVVDAALSDLKALARGADMPELRTQGQATAAQAVQALDAQVRATAAKAGPNVLTALEAGRAATKQKYVVSDVLDMLSGEPRQVFNQLTQNKDASVARLREVQKLAPQEMPTIARAFLEDLMDQATVDGGFTHADRLHANWQKLGTETKARLFPKRGQIADLDHFFLLAKKIKENPNPSGTAQVLASPKLNFAEILAFLPAKAIAKMLYSPEAVKYLTTAQRVSTGSSKAAQSLALTQVTKAAQSAGVSLEGIPALANDPSPATLSGTKK